MHPFLLNVKDLSKDRKASPNCFNFISIWPLLQYTQCSLCGDSASKFNASSYALRFIHLLTISFFGKGRPLLYAFYISSFVFVKMLLVIGRLLDISRAQRYFNSKSISYYFLKEEGYWVKQWINNQSSISVLLFSWVLFILYFSFESLNLSDYLSSYFFFAFIFSYIYSSSSFRNSNFPDSSEISLLCFFLKLFKADSAISFLLIAYRKVIFWSLFLVEDIPSLSSWSLWGLTNFLNFFLSFWY